MRIDWQTPGRYVSLGGISLRAWLEANHQGRAPAELVSEIRAIVEHDVSLSAIYHQCHRLGLSTSADARSAGLRAAARVRAVDPVPEPDPDAIWEASKRLAAELKHRVAEVNTIIVDLTDQTRPIAIVEMADLHLGGIGTDYDAIQRDAETIASTEGMFCVIGGDSLENFLEAWALSAMSMQVITASPQWRLFERYISIIRDKVLYARVGNHEAWTAKVAQIDKFGELMGKYQILNVQHIGVANIHVGGQEYVVESTHRFWGQSRLNQLWSPMRLLDYGITDNVDVAVVEHRHVPAAGWLWRRGKRRFLIRTGTYKTCDSWAAEHGFWGAEVAPACLIYWPEKHQIMIFHDVPTTASFLTFLRSK